MKESLSPSTRCVLGIRLRSSHSGVSGFTHWNIQQPCSWFLQFFSFPVFVSVTSKPDTPVFFHRVGNRRCRDPISLPFLLGVNRLRNGFRIPVRVSTVGSLLTLVGQGPKIRSEPRRWAVTPWFAFTFSTEGQMGGVRSPQ